MGALRELSRASSPFSSIIADRIATSWRHFCLDNTEWPEFVTLHNSGFYINKGLSIEAPLCVGLMPGRYPESLISRGRLFLYAVQPGTVHFVKTSTDDFTGGLTVAGAASGDCEDVSLYGLTFVSQLSSAPNPGLAIGLNNQYWNRINIVDCDIIGNHDGIQFFGNDFGSRPYARLLRNRVVAAHDAVTIKAHGIIESIGNSILSDSQNPSEWIDPANISLWKSAGIHFSANLVIPGDDFDPLNDVFLSVGDSIRVFGGTNIGGAGAQNSCSGILFYSPGGAQLNVPRTRIVSPNIYVEFDANQTPSNGVQGIRAHASISAVAGQVCIEGGSIVVIQKNVGAGAPSTVQGIHCATSAALPFFLRAVGTNVYVQNDKAASTANSASTGPNASAQMILSVFSEQPTSEGTAASINPATIRNT